VGESFMPLLQDERRCGAGTLRCCWVDSSRLKEGRARETETEADRLINLRRARGWNRTTTRRRQKDELCRRAQERCFQVLGPKDSAVKVKNGQSAKSSQRSNDRISSGKIVTRTRIACSQNARTHPRTATTTKNASRFWPATTDPFSSVEGNAPTPSTHLLEKSGAALELEFSLRQGSVDPPQLLHGRGCSSPVVLAADAVVPAPGLRFTLAAAISTLTTAAAAAAVGGSTDPAGGFLLRAVLFVVAILLSHF